MACGASLPKLPAASSLYCGWVAEPAAHSLPERALPAEVGTPVLLPDKAGQAALQGSCQAARWLVSGLPVQNAMLTDNTVQLRHRAMSSEHCAA